MVLELLSEYVDKSPENYVREEDALLPELVGMRYFAEPIWGCAPADDPYFDRLKEKQAIGPWFHKPKEWLPEAKSVLSVFLPYSDAVRNCEDLSVPEPSPGFLNARIDGNHLVNSLGRFIKEELEKNGFKAVVPTQDPNYISVWRPGSNERMKDPSAGYTSLWSERHAAFVCGLGTFGRSGCIITSRGASGRLVSVITDAELPITPRAYSEVYEYCLFCGKCASQCPVQAICMETGKNHYLCDDWLVEMKKRFAPRFACAKCQLGVPCAAGIPVKAGFRKEDTV